LAIRHFQFRYNCWLEKMREISSQHISQFCIHWKISYLNFCLLETILRLTKCLIAKFPLLTVYFQRIQITFPKRFKFIRIDWLSFTGLESPFQCMIVLHESSHMLFWIVNEIIFVHNKAYDRLERNPITLDPILRCHLALSDLTVVSLVYIRWNKRF
jgi:hypothetical protein